MDVLEMCDLLDKCIRGIKGVSGITSAYGEVRDRYEYPNMKESCQMLSIILDDIESDIASVLKALDELPDSK